MKGTGNFVKEFFGGLFVLLCFAFGLTACEVGLGGAIDTSDPRAAVTLPGMDGVLGGAVIHMEGSCEDDTGIAEVRIARLYGVEGLVDYSDLGNVTLSEDGRSWSFDFTQSATSKNLYTFNGQELNLPDGSYEISLLPVDIGGRMPKNETKRSFKIDNTPPIFLITSPSSKNIDDPSPYGKTIKVKGNIFDTSDHMRDITVSVYDTSGSQINIQKTTDMTTVLGGKDKEPFEVLVAKQNSSEDAVAAANYDLLYPGTGKYYMEIELEDMTNRESDLPGNKASIVYFRAPLYEKLKREAGISNFSGSDLMRAYNGTHSSFTTEQCDKIRRILDGTYDDDTSYYAKVSNSNSTRLAFSVNPNNKPKYSFGGMAYESGTNPTEWSGRGAAGGSISISVMAGSDEYLVKPSTLKVYIQAVNESGVNIGSRREVMVRNDEGSELGSTGIDSATYIVTLPDDLTDTYYELSAEGKGYNNETGAEIDMMSAKASGGYGFVLFSNKIPVTITSDADQSYVRKVDSNNYSFAVKISDPNNPTSINKSTGKIKYQIQTAQGYKTKHEFTSTSWNSVQINSIEGSTLEGPVSGLFSKTISNLDFTVNDDSVGTIALRIWGDNGVESDKNVYLLYVDNKKPTITVNNNSELTGSALITERSSNYVAADGEYRLSGTWRDEDGSGVKILKYSTDGNTWTNIGTEYTSRVTDVQSWSVQIPVEEGDGKKIYLKAIDLAGNESEKTYENIKFDFSDPEFTTVPTVTKDDYVTSGRTFTAVAIDSFGLDTITAVATRNNNGSISTVNSGTTGYNFEVANTAGADTSKTATITMNPLNASGSDGVWEITLTAKDKNDRTATTTFGFTVDNTPPVVKNGSIKIQDLAYSLDAWQKLPTAKVTGTITEAISLDSVYYLVKKADETPLASPTDITGMAGVQSVSYTNRSGDVNFSISVDGLKDNSTHGNIVYIQPVDKAGNKGTVSSYTINVDQVAPSIGALKYKIGSGTASEATGTVAVNTQTLTLWGTYTDACSGVNALGFEIGSASVTPTSIEYTTENVTASNIDSLADSAWTAYNAANAKTIKGWKATFESNKFANGTIKVSGTDIAGNGTSIATITLKKDTVKPTVSNVSIEGAYRKTDTVYYVNNATTQIKVKGVSADDYALNSTVVTIPGLASSPITLSGTSWTTENLNISGLTGSSVTVTAVSKDTAGNESTPVEITLNFDTTAPSRKKNVNTRSMTLDWGSANNWEDSEFGIGSGHYYAESYSGSTSLQIRGVFDEDGSGVSAVYYELVNGTTDLSLNGSNYATKGTLIVPNADGSFGVTLSGLQEGSNKLRVIAVDNVGNWSKITDSTDKYESDFILGLDQTAPAFGNGFTLDGSAEYVTGTSDFTISGGTVSDDRAGVDPSQIKFWFVNKNNPSTRYEITRTAGTYGQLTYTQTDPTDSNLSGDVSITVTPGTWFTEANLGTSPILYGSLLDYSNPKNNSGTVTILTTIKLDQTQPAIAIDNNLNTTPITDENDGGKIKKVGDNYFYELSGTWSDANGSGTDKLFYSINNGTDWIDADTLATKNYAKSKAESSWSLSIPVSEGTSYNFAVKAKDAAGNEKEAKPNKTVTFDFSKPTITVDLDSGVYGQTRPQATVTASDHYQIKATDGISVVSAKRNGVNAVSGTDYTLSALSGGGTATATRVVTILQDGVFEFTFKATDVNNRESDTITRTWTVDTLAPEAKADNDASYGLKINDAAARTWYRDTNLKFSGYVDEALSGLSKVYYLVNSSASATKDEVVAGDQQNYSNLKNNGSVPVAYSVTPTVLTGTSYVHMVFEDAAGNKSDVKTSTVKLDQEVPTLGGKYYNFSGVTADMPATLFVNTTKSETLTLYGLVTETGSGIGSLTLTKAGDAGFSPTITYATGLTSTSSAEAFAGATWNDNKTGATAWKATFNVNGLNTGAIQAAVNDLAGNSSSVQVVTLDSDSTAPTLTLTNSDLQTSPFIITENSPYMIVSGDEHNYTFQGTWSDTGSGTHTLYYSTTSTVYGTGTWYQVPTNSAPQSTGTTNWTLTLDLEEGTGKQIAFYAEDKVGNKSAVISKTGITVDYTDPTLTLSPETAETYYPLEQTNTAVWTINASDNLGTPAVTVAAMKDGSAVPSGTSGFTYNASTKTITLANNANANGTWNITVTATDGAGRTTVRTLNTIVDRSIPVINDDIEIHDGDVVKNYDVNSWSRNGTLTVKGTINEAGSGLSIVYFMKGVANGVTNLKEITSEDRKSVGVLGIGSSVEYEFTVSDLAAGSTVVGIQTEDKAGNLSDIKRITLNLDKTNPSFGSTTDRYYSFAQAADYKLMEGTILSNGTKDIYFVGPYSDAGSGVAELAFETVRDASSSATDCTVEYSTDTIASGATNIGSMSWKTYAQIADKTTIKSYRAKIGKDDFENGDSIVAKPLDRAGNGSTQPIFTIAIDSTAPVITLNTPKTKRLLPTADAESVNTVNGTITFAGTTDETSMDKLELYWGTAQNACNTRLTEKLGAQAYNWSFDVPLSTVDSGTVKFIDETNYAGSTKDIFLKLVATDKAGNVASYVYQYTVDPDKDRPIITFPQLDLSGLSESAFVNLTSDRTLNGSVTDDDGVTKLEYKIGSGDWTELTVTNGNFSYTFTDETNYTMKFRVTDAAGTEFETKLSPAAQYLAPKFVDKNAVASTYSVLNVLMDVTAPTISGKFYNYNNVTDDLPGSLFVNTSENKTLTLYGLVTETGSGIETLALTKAGDTFTPTIQYNSTLTGSSTASNFASASWGNSSAGATAWKATVSVSGLSNGAIQATVSDVAGNSGSAQIVALSSDATAPTLTLSNSDLQDAAAPYSITERSPYMNVDGEHHNYTFQGTWSDTGSGTYKLYYSTTTSTFNASTWDEVPTSSAPQATGTTNWTLTLDLAEGNNKQINFCAVDKVGNQSAIISKTGITVDYTDPTLTLTPATAETYYGVETTNTAVWTVAASDTLGTVNVSVVAKKDGTEVSSGTNGYTYSSNTITLGTTSDANGTWNIIVTAEDGAGRTTVKTLNTTVDRSKPVVTDTLEIHDGERVNDYDTGSWSKNGTLTLVGKINEAGSGLKTLYYKKNIALDATNIKDNQDSSISLTGVGAEVDYEVTVSGLSSGSTPVGIQVEDLAGNLSEVKIFTINVDKRAPTFSNHYYSYDAAANYTETGGTVLSNGENDLYLVGTYSDADSGIDQLKFEINETELTSSECTLEYSTDTIASGATNIGSMTWESYNQSNAGNYKSYRAKIVKNKFSSAGGVVDAKPIDRAGNGSTQTIFTIAIDNTAPVLTLNTPKTQRLAPTADAEAVNTVNGTVAFAGTTEETAMNRLELYWGTAQNACNTLIDTKAASQSYNWSFNVPFSTVQNGTTVKFIDGSNYTGSTKNIFLKLLAVDKAGNEAEYIYKYNVDPDGDRPIITFTQLDLTGLTENADASNVWLTDNATMSGNVTDDDGVTKLEYKLGDGSWNELTVTNGNFSYTFPDETKYSMQFRVTDAAGTQFVTKTGAAQYLAPKFVDKNTVMSNYSILNLAVDISSPLITDVKYIANNGTDQAASTDFTAKRFGGDWKKFKIRFNATDSNGIASGTVTFNGTEYATTKSGNTYTTDYIMLDTLPSKNYTAVITVRDNAGREGRDTTSASLVVDNDAPTVRISQPSSLVSMATQSVGSLSEANGLTHVYFMVTQHGVDPTTIDTIATGAQNGAGRWKEYVLSDANSSTFEIGFDSTNGVNHTDLLKWYLVEAPQGVGITTTDAINGTNGAARYTDITSVDLHIKAIDEYGNIGYATKTVTVDPQGDKPTVTITYPITGSTLGGSIPIMGTAIDNVAADNVMVMIDMNADGTWNKADIDALNALSPAPSWLTWGKFDGGVWADITYSDIPGSADDWTKYGIKKEVSNASWSFTVNQGAELNPASGTKDLAVWVYATDGDHNTSQIDLSDPDKTPYVTFKIDKDTPQIANEYLVQYDNGGNITAKYAYSKDMSITGEWYYEADMYDDSGIATVTRYILVDGVPAGSEEMNAAGSYDGGNIVLTSVDTVTVGGVNYTNTANIGDPVGFHIKMKVGSGTANEVVYQDWKLSYKENAGQALTGEREVALNVDNKAPVVIKTGDYYNIRDRVTNENGFYTFGTQAKEDPVAGVSQTGVKRVAFYFTRDIDTPSIHSLYDVMKAPGDDGNAIDGYASLTKEEGLYWKTLTGSASGKAFNLSSADPNVHTGGLVKINGVIYRIESVSGTRVSVEVNTTAAEPFAGVTSAKFAMANVVDNPTEETADETSSKVAGYYTNVNFDDGDLMVESLKKQSTTWTWEANINSKNIGDGSAKLHYVVFDAAGNYAEEEVNVFVANNQPRIAGVSIGTDTNGNGTVDAAEMISEGYSNIYAKGKQGSKNVTEAWFPSDKASSVLKILGRTKIIPEIVGGNGQLDYSYKVHASDGAGNWLDSALVTGSGTNIGTGNNDSDDYQPLEVDLSMAKLLGMGNASGSNFALTISDQTPGAALTATLNIIVDSLLQDNNKPKSRIIPFYWVNGTKNSLFMESKDYGHIELPKDLPSAFVAGAGGVYDRDPKISGIVKIEGIAHDDVLLNSLTVNVGGNDYNIGTYNGGWTYTNAWDGSAIPNGSWKSLVTNATYREAYDMGFIPQADFDALDEVLKDTPVPYITAKYGHIVHWTLYIDSSIVGNGTDKAIRTSARDRGMAAAGAGDSVNYTPNSWTEANDAGVTANVSDSGTPTGYQRVDVVPYITKISTSVRTASGLKDNNIRSASGKYSILANKAANAITVSGFNFASGNNLKARLVNTATAAGTSVTSTSGGIAVTITQNSSTSATITNTSVTKSGYLELFSNGIRALNNINNNDSYGTAKNSSGAQLTNANATVTDYANAYNREADYYTTKNVQLTDDRYLLLFDMHTAKTPSGSNKWKDLKNAYYPVMIMNGDNPVFGYMNGSGGPSADVGTTRGTGAGSYQPSHAMPQRAEFNGTNGSEVYTEYLIKASAWDAMGMAVDEGGRYYNVSAYNRDGAAMSLIYDRYAELYSNGQGWGAGTGYSSYSGNWSYSSGNNAIILDSMNYGDGVLLGRYMYPKIIANGNSKTGNAKVYMAYYDDGTGQIVFRNFQLGTSGTTALDNSHSDKNGTTYKQKINFSENTNNYASGVAEGRLTAVASGSRYYDMVVTSDNHVVIVYYDENASKLKLIYSTYAVDGTSPTANVAWTTSTVSFPDYVGTYCSMTIDSSNGIHIAAFDAGEADLKYFYLPSYSSTSLTNFTVDAAGSVGQWTGIAICTDSDNEELYGKPVISYYNSTETGSRESIKMAYPKAAIGSIQAGVDSNGYTTGNWEYMTVPSITPPQGGDSKFQKVCLGFDTAGIPVLGFCASNLEFGKQIGE